MKFVITSEHLARERARLDELENQLKDDRAKLDEFERAAVRLVESFGPGDQVAPKEPSPAKPTAIHKASIAPQASAPHHNRPYTPEQIETLRIASRPDLAKLAKDWGRTTDGLEKKREELRAIERRKAAPAPVAEPAREEPVSEPKPAPFEGLTPSEPLPRVDVSNLDRELRPEQADKPESSEVFDKTSNHEWNARSQSGLRPGRPVSGRLIDNGPLDPRILDPVAFASKNS